MSHRICNIHVATSCFPIQRLLAWHISTCNAYSFCGCQGLPRHTIMWNSLGFTWKSRSDSEEHWKGAPPFVSCQCFPNKSGRSAFPSGGVRSPPMRITSPVAPLGVSPSRSSSSISILLPPALTCLHSLWPHGAPISVPSF